MPARRATPTSGPASPTMMVAADIAAGARHRLLQDDGIGLGDAERVGAADRGKSPAQVQLVEQQLRQPFELVGADRKAAAVRREIVERGFQSLERARGVGDVVGVIVDEILRAGGRVPRRSSRGLRLRARARSACARRRRSCCAPIASGTGGRPSRSSTKLRAAIRSGAVSTSVPSRSKTTMRGEVMGKVAIGPSGPVQVGKLPLKCAVTEPLAAILVADRPFSARWLCFPERKRR